MAKRISNVSLVPYNGCCLTNCFEGSYVEIRLRRRHIFWSKCEKCVFLASQGTRIRRKRMKWPTAWKSMRITVPGCSYMVSGFWWIDRYNEKFVGKLKLHPYMVIWWNRRTHNFREVWVWASQVQRVNFAAFSNALRNWWENPYIFHVM